MKEKFGKKIKFFIAVILIIAAFIAGYFVGNYKIFSETENINITILKSELSAISELATYEYTYSDRIEDSTTIRFADKFDIPFTSNSYTISYDGIIKAGVNLNNLELEAIDDAIIVKLPQAQVLDQYPVATSIKVVDQKNNILNPFELQDIFDLIAKNNEAQKELAIKQGLLTLSAEQAKTTIRKFITSVYGEEINIVFK